MKITENTEYFMSHPSFKQAIKNFNDGDKEDLTYLLEILQKESVNRTKESMIKRWTQWKHLNTCDIRIELNRAYSPDDLDVRLPIVKPAETLTKKVTNKLKNFFVPQNQLNLFVQVA